MKFRLAWDESGRRRWDILNARLYEYCFSRKAGWLIFLLFYAIPLEISSYLAARAVIEGIKVCFPPA